MNNSWASSVATETTNDDHHMRSALALAQRGLGQAWPNPSVGCVLVKDGHPVGRGWTQAGGRPHAETQALTRAGDGARGATAYVTLEPCAHHGQSPPCATALVEAGVAKVVVACRDPDGRVNGAGIDTLKSAGVEVVEGVLESEARDLNVGFFRRVETNRPLVTLKLAASIDGRIATSEGQSKWITGPLARAHGHGFRGRHDAVLVGSGTVRADDPALTCRLPGMGDRSPVRVVLEGHRAISTSAKIVTTAKKIATWIFTTDAADTEHCSALESQGVEVHSIAADADGHPDLEACLGVLGDKGVTRVMVEGGGTVAAAFLRSAFVDRLMWARGAQVLGGDGLAAVGELGLGAVDGAPKFRRIETLAAGDDIIETYSVDRI